MKLDWISRLAKFAGVGLVGLFFDIFVVFTLVHQLGMSEVLARFPAWLIAVHVTYGLNLAFTFRKTKRKLPTSKLRLQRHISYITSQGVGGIVNIVSYSLLVILSGASIAVAICIGTILGLIFNYLGASFVINRKLMY